MKLVYPACFYVCEEGGYSVDFPDLPGCITEGDTLAEAIEMAIDAASGWLLLSIEDKEELPAPSDINTITLDGDGLKTLVPIDLDSYAQEHGQKAVKKTLTIPAWLNSAAEKQDINFSQALQSALRQKLGL